MLSLASEQTAALVEPKLLLDEIRAALAQPAPGDITRSASQLSPRDITSVAYPLRAPGVPAYVVRVIDHHFLQPRVVTYLLHDAGVGARLAVMDGAFLASLAVGCVGALQAPAGGRIGVLGAGEAVATTLWMLGHLRPIEEVLVYDARPGRAESLAKGLAAELEIRVRAATREEALAAPLTLDEDKLAGLDASVAECVAVWHCYSRARG